MDPLVFINNNETFIILTIDSFGFYQYLYHYPNSSGSTNATIHLTTKVALWTIMFLY